MNDLRIRLCLMEKYVFSEGFISEVEASKYLLDSLFDLPRSLAGDANRQTLEQIRKFVGCDKFKVEGVCSGTDVFDWKVPKEWKVKSAYIRDENGNKVVDIKDNFLHLVSYSNPVDEIISYDSLKERLHYLKSFPKAIPYRTSYYDDNWGFCLSYEQFLLLDKNINYHVFIDSEFVDGEMNYGEVVVKGESTKEVLISTYICHPNLGNDNLSGVVLTALLAKRLLSKKTYYTYRFVFLPETIGAVAYCSLKEDIVKAIDFGFVVSTVAGRGKLGFKRSWDPSFWLNTVVRHQVKAEESDFIEYEFDMRGSDERQFSSPGFRLNMISITKDKYYEYPEYHTSLDNLNFISPEALVGTLKVYANVIDQIEKMRFIKRSNPYCEVMLSKHDLYPKVGGGFEGKDKDLLLSNIMEILFKADGKVPFSLDRLKDEFFNKAINQLLSKKIISIC